METSKKRTTIRKTALFVSTVLVPLSFVVIGRSCFDIRYQSIKVTGTIQAKEIPVASKLGGRIEQVCVQEGQEVKKGEILVRFEAPELEARRKQLIALVAEEEAHLEELKNGPRQAEIDRAKAIADGSLANFQMLKSGFRKEDVEKAQSQRLEAEENYRLLKQGYRVEEVAQAKHQLEQARVNMDWQNQEFNRYRFLSQQGAVSTRDAGEFKSKYEGAVAAYHAAQQNYARMLHGPRSGEIEAARERLHFAKGQEQLMRRGPRTEEIEAAKQQYLSNKQAWALLQQGTRRETIARAEATLKQRQAQLQELEAQLKERQVVSPADAEVSVMDLHAGEVIGPDKAIATLTRLDDVWTRVYIPERELARVRMGQEVSVRADAFPGRTFVGKVVQIPSVAEFTPRNVQTPEERSAQVFGLKVKIENPSHLLRGGMNAELSLPPVEGPFQQIARSEHVSGDRP